MVLGPCPVSLNGTPRALGQGPAGILGELYLNDFCTVGFLAPPALTACLSPSPSYCLTFLGKQATLHSVTLGEGGTGRRAALLQVFFLVWPMLGARVPCGTLWHRTGTELALGQSSRGQRLIPKKKRRGEKKSNN